MGLNCSHGAFDGPYSLFNRFRQDVAEAVGAKCPPHNDKTLDDEFIYFPDNMKSQNPGLREFLIHSDCDGEIPHDMCGVIAEEMIALIPLLRTLPALHDIRSPTLAKRFAKGCLKAARSKSPLRFG